jgi:hypothetical protein
MKKSVIQIPYKLFLIGILNVLVAHSIFSQKVNLIFVVPSYEENFMKIIWQYYTGASEYQVHRSIDAGKNYGPWTASLTLNEYIDKSVSANVLYTYQVRMKVGTDWVGTSDTLSNIIAKAWPVSDGKDFKKDNKNVLNGFNMAIEGDGDQYLHEGIDLNGNINILDDYIKSPVGGIIINCGNSNNVGEKYINIKFFISQKPMYIQFNHIQDISIPISIKTGKVVKPGDTLGYMYNNAYWQTLSCHTHFHYWSEYNNMIPSTMDPHLIFEEDLTSRDPYLLPPRVTNVNLDGESIRYLKDEVKSVYFPVGTKAIYGETDIVVDAIDEQSEEIYLFVNPKSVGYYVEKYNGSTWDNAIASKDEPLVLIDNANGFYNSPGDNPNKTINKALFEFDELFKMTTLNYYWKHWFSYKVTNGYSTKGFKQSLDTLQCWATNARTSSLTANGYKKDYQKARVNDEAKFEDNNYRVNIRLTDYINQSPDYNQEIIVDNFMPYVKKVKMVTSDIIYEAGWTWDEGSYILRFSSNSLKGIIKSNEDLAVTITTSETMKELTLSVPVLFYEQISTTPEANSDGKEWKFNITADYFATLLNKVKIKLEISGKDLADNEMFGFISKDDLTTDLLPQKNKDGSWTVNPQIIKDTLHYITKIDKLDLKIKKTEWVKCNGGSDGSAQVSIENGTGPYKYNATGPVGASGSFSDDVFTINNLKAGDYNLEVTDRFDSKGSVSFTIYEPSKLKQVMDNSVKLVSCDPNPKVTLMDFATGGTPPLSYSWPGGMLVVSSSGTYTCTVTDRNGCTSSASVNVIIIPVRCSRDPNEINGPKGYSSLQYISVNDNLQYNIKFENDPEFATAPAQKVVVHFPVDNSLNINSLQLADFGFDNMIFQVPSNKNYYTGRLDLTDSLGIYVDVTAGIDISKNEIFWIFESIDPATGLAPADAKIGFLPINDKQLHNGEGYVNFSINPKKNDLSGDSVSATASIFFDKNEPVITNTWNNIIDAKAPESSIASISMQSEDSYLLTFDGTDDASGIKSYSLYYSLNNGIYQLLTEGILDTSVSFTGKYGNIYSFFTRSSDNVGNIEVLKTQPETSVLFGSISVSSPMQGNNYCPGDTVDIRWSSKGFESLNIDISSDGGVHFSNVVSNISATDSVYFWQIPLNAIHSNSYIVKAYYSENPTMYALSNLFTINALPVVYAGKDSAICFGNSIKLNASGGTVYKWNHKNDLDNAEIKSPVANPFDNTSYIVVASDDNGCIAQDTVKITVLNLPDADFSGLYLQYCSNSDTSVLTGTPAGGIFSGNGVKGNYYIPNQAGPGIHLISYIVTDNNSCSNSSVKSVEVYDFPKVSFTGLQDKYYITDGIDTLKGLPDGGYFNGFGISGNTFNPVSAGLGDHQIIYTYTDENGCTNSKTQTVTVVLKDLIAKNNDLENYISVFPNPAKDYFTIELHLAKETHGNIYLINVAGEKLITLKHGRLSSEKIIVKTNDLHDGLYFIQLITNENTTIERIVIQR